MYARESESHVQVVKELRLAMEAHDDRVEQLQAHVQQLQAHGEQLQAEKAAAKRDADAAGELVATLQRQLASAADALRKGKDEADAAHAFADRSASEMRTAHAAECERLGMQLREVRAEAEARARSAEEEAKAAAARYTQEKHEVERELQEKVQYIASVHKAIEETEAREKLNQLLLAEGAKLEATIKRITNERDACEREVAALKHAIAAMEEEKRQSHAKKVEELLALSTQREEEAARQRAAWKKEVRAYVCACVCMYVCTCAFMCNCQSDITHAYTHTRMCIYT